MKVSLGCASVPAEAGGPQTGTTCVSNMHTMPSPLQKSVERKNNKIGYYSTLGRSCFFNCFKNLSDSFPGPNSWKEPTKNRTVVFSTHVSNERHLFHTKTVVETRSRSTEHVEQPCQPRGILKWCNLTRWCKSNINPYSKAVFESYIFTMQPLIEQLKTKGTY